MKRKTIGILNGIIASVAYGCNPLFALPLYMNNINTNSILFYRYAIAVLLYGIWIKFVKNISLKINPIEFAALFFLGMLFSLSSLTLFESFKYIEVSIACTILFIYPVIVLFIMAVFFREKVYRNTLLAVILVLLGVVLLYKGDSVSINLKGIINVLLSALFYALYIVGIKKIKPIMHLKPDKLNFYVMLFGLLVYIYNLKFCTQLQVLDDIKLWIYVICLALFPTIISIEAITIAIKLAGSTTTAILGALEPVSAIFFAVVFFKEVLTIKMITGIILILSGVIFIVSKKSGKPIINTHKSAC